jgi:hypothetical protein
MYASFAMAMGGALQSPETTKAHPLSVEEVGFASELYAQPTVPT